MKKSCKDHLQLARVAYQLIIRRWNTSNTCEKENPEYITRIRPSIENGQRMVRSLCISELRKKTHSDSHDYPPLNELPPEKDCSSRSTAVLREYYPCHCLRHIPMFRKGENACLLSCLHRLPSCIHLFSALFLVTKSIKVVEFFHGRPPVTNCQKTTSICYEAPKTQLHRDNNR